MRIDILTLFAEMFEGVITSSIAKRAIEKEIIEVHIHDFRENSSKANKRVDDYSYGGGAGMIIEIQPVLDCLRTIPNNSPLNFFFAFSIIKFLSIITSLSNYYLYISTIA